MRLQPRSLGILSRGCQLVLMEQVDLGSLKLIGPWLQYMTITTCRVGERETMTRIMFVSG